MRKFSSLGAPKLEMVNELCTFVGATQVQSLVLLEKFNWNIVRAANAFFSGEVDIDALVARKGPVSPAAPDFTSINNWFDRYADEGDRDTILDDGIQAFYSDLGVDTQDLVVLVISWKMKAEEMCIYTRKEWRHGMVAMGVSSARQLRRKLDALRNEVADRRSTTFHDFYMYCFEYAKERHKKSIELDVCLSMWDVVLVGPEFPLIKEFSEFLRGGKMPVVTKDMWAQTLAFLCHVKTDLSNFDDTDAWPVVVDDFVEMKLSKQKNVPQSQPARP